MRRLCCIHGAMWLVFFLALAWSWFVSAECAADRDGCAHAMERYP